MKPLTGLPVESFVQVSQEANIPLKDLLQLVQQVENGASAAFLARYRVDLCGGLNEHRLEAVLQKLRDRQNLVDHKISMLTTLGQRGVLTDELREQLERATDRRDLNDIFYPYRSRKGEAADEAIRKGLDPLARTLWFQDEGIDLDVEAGKHVDPQKGVADPAQVLDGACDIAARWLGHKPEIVRELRKLYLRDCELVVTAKPAASKHLRTKALDGYRAKISTIPWQKRLAIRRGVRTGLLETSVELSGEIGARYLQRCLVKSSESVYAPYLKRVVASALRNGLAERVKKDALQQLDEATDAEAIESFQKTLHSALLAAPAHGLNIVGIETGRSGGWRVALIGRQGELLDDAVVREEDLRAHRHEREGSLANPDVLQSAQRGAATADPAAARQPITPSMPTELEHTEPQSSGKSPTETVAPSPPSGSACGDAESTPVAPAPVVGVNASEEQTANASPGTTSPSASGSTKEASGQSLDRKQARHAELSEFLRAHDVNLIVVPAGPKPHTTARLLRSEIRRSGKTSIAWLTVRDTGTWIYASSKAGKREFPKLETAVRSAISLARRVQDPMAEFAKTDPKTLGIGLNCHEVDAERLRASLRRTIACTVHDVGVDLNGSSIPLLSMVPGLTERLAKRIVEYRREHGPFRTRAEVKNVQGLSERIFAQAAGFVRVEGDDPLDNTGVHPECRGLIDRIGEAAGCDLATLLAEPERLDGLNPEQFATAERSVEVVQSTIRELRPERRQARGTFQLPKPAVPLRTDEELKPGTNVAGVVSSIADFGAFVDIGADQDALLHISQIRREHVTDSKPSFQVGDAVDVFVKATEQDTRRIALSMWDPQANPARARSGDKRAFAARKPDGQRRRATRSDERNQGGKALKRTFGPNAKRQSRGGRQNGKMSMQQKLDMLQDKYRTKV